MTKTSFLVFHIGVRNERYLYLNFCVFRLDLRRVLAVRVETMLFQVKDIIGERLELIFSHLRLGSVEVVLSFQRNIQTRGTNAFSF